MIERFGEGEIIALTDRANTGEIDDAVLQRALDEADAEINSYIAARYPAPFPEVPTVLVGVACNIARYKLTGADVMATDDMRKRYEDARSYLRLLGRGEVTLGVDADGSPDGGQPAASSVKFKAGRRRFNAETMRGYE